MDTPTVGRIVQVLHPHSDPASKYENAGTPGATQAVDEGAFWCAAIVTHVASDGSISATVFRPSGDTIPLRGIIEGDGIGHWRWPPRA